MLHRPTFPLLLAVGTMLTLLAAVILLAHLSPTPAVASGPENGAGVVEAGPAISRAPQRQNPQAASPFDRNAAEDWNGLSHPTTGGAEGIWSDGTTMWIVDITDLKLYAYDMATKARLPDKDFGTLKAAGNTWPEDIWSDGVTMWVADDNDKLFAYNMATKARSPDQDFNTLSAAGNTGPEGIWSDGSTIWVADHDHDKLFAYDLATKARTPSEDFNTLGAAGNNWPIAIWSDGKTMWVSDWTDDKLYAYDMSTKGRAPNLDFNTLSAAGNHAAEGIWSDGTTMWVRDNDDRKIYAYHMPAVEGIQSSVVFTGKDYDTDDDGLIEVSSLAQLDAIRYDLDGDGTVDDPDMNPPDYLDYFLAYPDAANGMSCPAAGCIGYELTADLDFDTNGNGRADAGDAYWNGGRGWLPIGYSGTAFSRFNATFDGGGHTIANLHVNRRDLYIGLFAASDAVIRRVGLVSGSVSGDRYVGTLVGWNNGAMTDSYATVAVTSTTADDGEVGGLVGYNRGTITRSHATGIVLGGNGADQVGGLVGTNSGAIAGSYAAGAVGGGWNVGGLVGSNFGDITSSYAEGSVSGYRDIGGLVGENFHVGAIADSYATGNVTRYAGGADGVGGLVGSNYGSASSITHSYAIGKVAGSGTGIGGLVGYNGDGYDEETGQRLTAPGTGTITNSYWDTRTSGRTSGTGGVGKTTVELQTPTTAAPGIYATWDAMVWDFGTSNQYPKLRNVGAPAHIGLSSVPQLYWVDEEAQKIQRTAAGDYRRVEDQLTAAKGLNMPGSIALDLNAGKVYWTDDGAGKVQRANLDGTDVQDLIAGLDDPVGIALDLGERKMYWIERTKGEIWRADLNGNGSEAVVSWLSRFEPYQIALDRSERKLYITIRKAHGILRLNLDDLSDFSDFAFLQPSVGASAIADPMGLALDLSRGRMYWTERHQPEDKIRRANLDGSGAEDLITSAGHSLSGIALDIAAGKMYWTDEVAGAIKRADLDGGNEQTVVTGLSAPEGIAIYDKDRAALMALYGNSHGETILFLPNDVILPDSDILLYTNGCTPRVLARHINKSRDSIPALCSEQNERDWGGITRTQVIEGQLHPILSGTGTVDQIIFDSQANIRIIWQYLEKRGELPQDYIPPYLSVISPVVIIPGWSFGDTWLTDQPIGEWEGVILNHDGRVTELNLSSNGLRGGAIPLELTNLDRLQRLDLSGNSLTGTIPPELANLELKHLNLIGNDLSGCIPRDLLPVIENTYAAVTSGSSVGANAVDKAFDVIFAVTTIFISELEALNPGLSGWKDFVNATHGLGLPPCPKLPPNPELAGQKLDKQTYDTDHQTLISIRDYYLDQVNDGQVSDEHYRFVQEKFETWQGTDHANGWLGVKVQSGRVVDLNLSERRLKGGIPPEIGNLGSLKILNLSRNHLSGTIPPALGNLRELETLALNGRKGDSNRLGGPLPLELGNLSSLRHLFLHETDVKGELPLELGNLVNLIEVNFVATKLTGCLPPPIRDNFTPSLASFANLLSVPTKAATAFTTAAKAGKVRGVNDEVGALLDHLREGNELVGEFKGHQDQVDQIGNLAEELGLNKSVANAFIHLAQYAMLGPLSIVLADDDVSEFLGFVSSALSPVDYLAKPGTKHSEFGPVEVTCK